MNSISADEKARRDEGFAAHRREQLQRWALVPFADKLQWLEDAHHMALALQKSREGQLKAKQDQREAAAPAGTST